jgi:hypothetical protein
MSILSGLLHKGDDEHTAKAKADKKAKREAKVARQKTTRKCKKSAPPTKEASGPGAKQKTRKADGILRRR